MKFLLAAFFLTIFATTVIAQERRELPQFTEFGSPATDQQAAVNAFISNYEKAWRDLNAEALAKLHAQDTEWINAYARMFRGREALFEFLQNRLFPQFRQQLSEQNKITFNRISTRYLDESNAVVHLFTDLQLQNDPLRRVHFHLVVQRHASGWQVVHTAIMDAR